MSEAAVILVVDDSSEVRVLLAKILDLEGYEVIEAGDGREALQLMADRRVDMVLLDAMMPKVNGWETLKAIRDDEDTAEIPVVLCTARDIDPTSSPGWQKADGALHKPFKRAEVVEAVAVALAGRKSSAESGMTAEPEGADPDAPSDA